MVTLNVENVHFGYRSKPVLQGATAAASRPGTLTALVGPNAAGKTTLMKCMAGLLRYWGRITLDGRDISRMRRSELTSQVSYLPQDVPVHAVLTVFEAILLACRPGGSAWHANSDDLARVERALAELDIEHLGPRYLNELSGGQRQLVSIAQALVRQPRLLLLDEPTSNLDLQRQLEVLSLVRSTTEATGMTTFIILHDLNLAIRFASHFVVLTDGRVYSQGPPGEVVTTEMLRDVYGVHADVIVRPDGTPQVDPIASLRTQPAVPG